MSLRSFYNASYAIGLLLSIGLTIPMAHASNYQDLNDIRTQVRNFLLDQFPTTHEKRTTISVNQLDTRLRFHRCDKILTFSLRDPGNPGGQVSVKAQCNGSVQWSLFVGADIEQEIDIYVAARNLSRGTVISTNDFTVQSAQLSQLTGDYINTPTQLLGKELIRNLSGGDSIRLAHLTDPNLVERGDAVVIEARIGQTSVITSGVALMAGQEGAQIRVRNDSSKQVINAKVIAPGKVEPVL